MALAARQIDSRGRAETSTTQDSNHDESWFIWKTGETNTASNSSDTRIKRSVISARDDVSLSAGDAATLAATDINGRNVALSGKDLTLDSQVADSASSSSNHAWKNSWAYNRDQSETSQRQEGVRIRAEQDATLTAAATAADNQAVDGAQPRGQIAIRGGSVSAGQDIRLQADGGVKLSGVTETDTRSDRGNRKNDGASLKPALGTMLPASSAWRKASCAPAVIWISAPAAISTPRRQAGRRPRRLPGRGRRARPGRAADDEPEQPAQRPGVLGRHRRRRQP